MVFEVRRVVVRVVVGGGEADGRLLDGKGAVGLVREVHVRADPRNVVGFERRADGEPVVDEPVTKGGAVEVEGDQAHPLHVLDPWWLMPDDAWRCVE